MNGPTMTTTTSAPAIQLHRHADGVQVECRDCERVVGVRWSFDTARNVQYRHAAAVHGWCYGDNYGPACGTYTWHAGHTITRAGS